MGAGKKVIGNSIIMYVQLILNVLIGLVTVRLLLNALGQSDYGLYDLIGGVIGLFGFITSSLAQSSMRFVSVSLGKGDDKDTASVFNSCFWLHVFIAIALCLILEIIGLFIFHGFLNIEPQRVAVAKVVFHCMVFSLFVNINVSPLIALVSSYENFLFVAIVSIADSLLKLGIAVAVYYTMKDKLLVYGLLMVSISVVDYLLYFSYSRRKYVSVSIIRRPCFPAIKKVMGFAGWTMLDTFSSVINRQGYAIMLNRYFGTVMNSAFAVSRQLEGHVYSVSASVVNAMKPQIMKSYGSGDQDRMFRLSLTAGKFGFFMMSFICVPLIVMMPDVLRIWLGRVPENTVTFCRLLILACMANQLTMGLVHANQAIGNIKWFSIIVSTMRVLSLPVSIIALKMGAEAKTTILVFLIFETIGSFCRVFILSRISSFKSKTFFQKVFLKIIPPTVFALVVCYWLYNMKNSIVWMIIIMFVTWLVLILTVWMIGLTKEERFFLIDLLKSLFLHNKRLSKFD